MQEKRDLSFDAFRGLAIIAVVGIHAYEIGWRQVSAMSVYGLFIIAYRQFLNFAVPAFVFISGYWLSKKKIESLEDYKNFLTKNVRNPGRTLNLVHGFL